MLRCASIANSNISKTFKLRFDLNSLCTATSKYVFSIASSSGFLHYKVFVLACIVQLLILLLLHDVSISLLKLDDLLFFLHFFQSVFLFELLSLPLHAFLFPSLFLSLPARLILLPALLLLHLLLELVLQL